jgi:hypothetical protein
MISPTSIKFKNTELNITLKILILKIIIILKSITPKSSL